MFMHNCVALHPLCCVTPAKELTPRDSAKMGRRPLLLFFLFGQLGIMIHVLHA